ncbi:MAG: DUF4249 family protein [Balneolaceae bacterium]|nr:DUF4249 family protein [Balneolaceae bacterium]
MDFKLLFKALPIFFIGVLFNTGCENRAIDPFEDRTDVFSIYGALNMQDSVNTVRVKNTQTYLLQDSADIKPMTLSFENMESGNTDVLDPMIINFNGNYTYNYPIREDLKPEQKYKITVTDPDGKRSTAVATMPGITIPAVDTLGINNDTGFGEPDTECFTEHTFLFTNVKEDEQIFMFSGIEYNGRKIWARTRTVDAPTRIANTDTLSALLSVKHLIFDHFPLSDERYVHVNPRYWPSTVHCRELDSNEITIRYFHLSADWKFLDGEDISTDNLFDSGVVDNGIGFFGGMNSGEYSYHFKQ